MYQHEMNPAPGATRRASGETVMSARSWKQKWEDCIQFFQRQNNSHPPGSKKLLMKAWKCQDRLRERIAKSHSKCDTCSKIDSKLWSLRGINTAEAKDTRDKLKRAAQEHEQYHLGDRAVLDRAGFLAIIQPRNTWTLLCDAATERTYTLPRFVRRAKMFGSRPFFNQKLMAVRIHTTNINSQLFVPRSEVCSVLCTHTGVCLRFWFHAIHDSRVAKVWSESDVDSHVAFALSNAKAIRILARAAAHHRR